MGGVPEKIQQRMICHFFNKGLEWGREVELIYKSHDVAHFNEHDIRFTQKGDTLYAICLGWPGQELAIRTLGYNGKLYPGEIQKISLLGAQENLLWEQTGDALLVRFPKSKPGKYAYALKIQR